MSRYKWGTCVSCKDNKTLQAREMCFKCYQRWRRNEGDTSDPDYANKGKKCSVEGCDKNARRSGMCITHDYRIKKFGDTDAHLKVGSYEGEECLIPGCHDRPRGELLCYNHYQNYKYHKQEGHVKDVAEYIEFRLNKPDYRAGRKRKPKKGDKK